MITLIKDLCVECGANRELLREMIQEDRIDNLETENHAQARIILDNCESCSEALK